MGTYLTAAWSIPVGVALLLLLGAFRARATMKAVARRRRLGSPPFVPPEQLVIVQIPTIGRHDVMPALRRVVASFETFMPERFARWRVDIVSEEGCEAVKTLESMASDHVRILYVPADYVTPGGTERKARANHWINEVRLAQGEAGDDVWVLHMDDDTGIAGDTAREFARFILENPAGKRSSLHLAQGVLTYPREFSANVFVWLADSVRPSCDLSMFCMTTGSGSPLIGAHGELLLVRASVEARIGWDFGRLLSITEDANFALTFASRYPRKSGSQRGATAALRNRLAIWSPNASDGHADSFMWRATGGSHGPVAHCLRMPLHPGRLGRFSTSSSYWALRLLSG